MSISPRRAAIALNTYVTPAIDTHATAPAFRFSGFHAGLVVAALLGAAIGFAAPAYLPKAEGVYNAVALTQADGNVYAEVVDHGLTYGDCQTVAALYAAISCELEQAR